MHAHLRPALLLLLLLAACGGGEESATPDAPAAADAADAADADVPHEDDHDHEHGHGEEADHEHAGGEDHAHDEVPLGAAVLGDLEVELAQGHGHLVAGEEAHLVVKLPYSDQGATTVRAWLGSEDRTLSFVGKGEYAASHDDYDVHATAPDPLPADVRWWIELERPDGTTLVGSIDPILP